MPPRRNPIESEALEYPATPYVIDFTEAYKVRHWRDATGKMHEKVVDDRPRSSYVNDHSMGRRSAHSGLLLTPKQLRTRARRRIAKGLHPTDDAYDRQMKPLDEWDAEELAKGRPRNAAGNFTGRPPQYITRELHERAMEKFKALIREGMNFQSITALKTIQMVLESDEVDYKGKPVINAAQKLDAAKFLIEHIVGKPTQPTTTDISVKLQGILGAVMVNPAEGGYTTAHMGSRLGITDGSVVDAEWSDEDDDDEPSDGN